LGLSATIIVVVAATLTVIVSVNLSVVVNIAASIAVILAVIYSFNFLSENDRVVLSLVVGIAV
jgi:hypothetical protein